MFDLNGLGNHRLLTNESCVAWGLEFILKWHGKLDIKLNPIQLKHPSYNGIGFGVDGQTILNAVDIDTKEEWFDLADLMPVAAMDFKADCPLIFMYPNGVAPITGDLLVHCAIADYSSQQLRFISLRPQDSFVVINDLPQRSSAFKALSHSYKLHVLHHRPKGVPL
jgi:hypothetical protein